MEQSSTVLPLTLTPEKRIFAGEFAHEMRKEGAFYKRKSPLETGTSYLSAQAYQPKGALS
ncbi:hypothetical protein D7X94_02555 [Acutalibacter sp. 1XD8-33]|nr:hypothetical protein D7X94_02555 [Acutalibacter sp. 1XD8-33]